MDKLAPKGLLLDYGGTLVEEVGFDPRAGNELLLTRAVHRPEHIGLDQVLDRANRVSTLGIACKDIWFVGDRLDADVAGAKAAGMKAVWFHSGNSRQIDGADLKIASWGHLLRYFQNVSS